MKKKKGSSQLSSKATVPCLCSHYSGEHASHSARHPAVDDHWGGGF